MGKNCDYKKVNQFVVNPYNFVSLPEKKAVTKIAEKEMLHTGYMECKMIAKTPLAIIDSESKSQSEDDKPKANEGHISYNYYSYVKNDKNDRVPMIMGSSIRGMIRSVYEMVTNSCFSTLNKEIHLSQRVETGEPLKPGILIRTNENKKEVWKLYKATRHLVKVKNGSYIVKNDGNIRYLSDRDGRIRYDSGDKVVFEVNPIQNDRRHRTLAVAIEKCNNVADKSKSRNNKKHVGYISVGESIWNKKYESVFEKEAEKGKNIEIKTSREAMEKMMEDLSVTLETYRNPSINKLYEEKKGPHYGYHGFNQEKERGVIPIWYKQGNNGEIYLSKAAVGRVTLKKTLNELLENFLPCTKRDALCPACRLFGTAQDEKMGSRIRVTDAQAIYGTWKITPNVTLKELGSPHYSYLPFYLRSGEDYDDPTAQLSGRKMYWHNQKAATDPSVYKENNRNNRNNTVDLIKPTSQFTFRIYYDGITEKEREKLIWILNLGENKEDGKMCHKIGHGKPLGLGSVKICVTECKERIFENDQYGWNTCEVDRTENPFEKANSEVFKELEKILDFTAIPKEEEVAYPYIMQTPAPAGAKQNDLASHQWFAENKKSQARLPKISEQKQGMNLYQAVAPEKG